ncbi:MAG: hypothetical protein IPK59_08205 [Rhodospirillaceae bacterium]|nr:hypothetical protein [Rhodospirillaceae bacterium]
MKQIGARRFPGWVAFLVAIAFVSISCSRFAPSQAVVDVPVAAKAIHQGATPELKPEPDLSPFGYHSSYRAAPPPQWYEPIDNCGLNVAIAEAANAAANVDGVIVDSCDN